MVSCHATMPSCGPAASCPMPASLPDSCCHTRLRQAAWHEFPELEIGQVYTFHDGSEVIHMSRLPATHAQISSVLAVKYALRSFTAANMCACISTTEVSISKSSSSVVKVLHGDNCRFISHSQANLLTCGIKLQAAFQGCNMHDRCCHMRSHTRGTPMGMCGTVMIEQVPEAACKHREPCS